MPGKAPSLGRSSLMISFTPRARRLRGLRCTSSSPKLGPPMSEATVPVSSTKPRRASRLFSRPKTRAFSLFSTLGVLLVSSFIFGLQNPGSDLLHHLAYPRRVRRVPVVDPQNGGQGLAPIQNGLTQLLCYGMDGVPHRGEPGAAAIPAEPVVRTMYPLASTGLDKSQAGQQSPVQPVVVGLLQEAAGKQLRRAPVKEFRQPG